MARRKSRRWLVPLMAVAAACALAYVWMRQGLQPMPTGESRYVRFDRRLPLGDALGELGRDGIVKNPRAMRFYAVFRRSPGTVPAGSYSLAPGMTADQILKALADPVKQMVRLPETNWARRSASLLAKKNVTTADEYLALVAKPETFKDAVGFPLPAGSLEGYLYPDTYELPPLLGAKQTILRQLKTFESKIWRGLNQPKDLQRTIIIASIVELEVKLDDERPIIAGVIENRLAKGMPLQIDATVLYARQHWGALTAKEIRETSSPYNTYLHTGLPPGPICSPTVKSVRAAMAPDKNEYLYYVAMPDGHSVFAKTIEDHLKNVAERKRELARAAK